MSRNDCSMKNNFSSRWKDDSDSAKTLSSGRLFQIHGAAVTLYVLRELVHIGNDTIVTHG